MIRYEKTVLDFDTPGELLNELRPSKHYWLNALGFGDHEGLTYDGVLAIPIRGLFSGCLHGFLFKEFADGKWTDYLYPIDYKDDSIVSMGNRSRQNTVYVCHSYEDMLSAKKCLELARIGHFVVTSPVHGIVPLLSILAKLDNKLVKTVPKGANEKHLRYGITELGKEIINL